MMMILQQYSSGAILIIMMNKKGLILWIYTISTQFLPVSGGGQLDVDCSYRSDFNLYENWYSIYGPITDFWQYVFLNVPATNGSYQNMFDTPWDDVTSIKVIHTIDYDFDVLDFRNLLNLYYFPLNIIFDISIPLDFDANKERTLMVGLQTQGTSYDPASIYFKIGDIATGYYLTYDSSSEIHISLVSVKYAYIDLGKIAINDNSLTNLITICDLAPVNTNENIYVTARIKNSQTSYMSILKQDTDWMDGGDTYINIYLNILWEQSGSDKLYLCMESGTKKKTHYLR